MKFNIRDNLQKSGEPESLLTGDKCLHKGILQLRDNIS